MREDARASVAALADELDRCIEALWECMKMAGADTSYADDHDHAYRLGDLHLHAVNAVRELREDYREIVDG